MLVLLLLFFNLYVCIQLLLLLLLLLLLVYLFIFLLFNRLDSLRFRCKGDILFRNKVASLRNEVYFLLMTNRDRVD